MPHYLDTSALVKLVVAEEESEPLRRWLQEDGRDPVTSDLSRTELLRAVRRAAPDRLVRARLVVDAVTTLQVGTAVFESAGRLEPDGLRSLDAVHLATALELGDELRAFVTYDDRLARAAAANGIVVVAPA